MPQQIRIGVIGTSAHADTNHLAPLGSHPKVQLAALCGRNQEHAQNLANKHGIPAVYSDYRRLIEDGSLDALVIATPDDLHHPMALAGLDQGLHVMIDKPIALNANQAAEMLEKAETAKVRHMVFFNARWIPQVNYLHKLVEDGYIGRPLQLQMRIMMGLWKQPEYAWRFDKARANGIVGDLGAHLFDLARWCFGEVDKVHAKLDTFVVRPRTDGQSYQQANDTGLVMLQFASGAQGIIQMCAAAEVGDRYLQAEIALHGEKGTLESKIIFAGTDAGAGLNGVQTSVPNFKTFNIPESHQVMGHHRFIDSIIDNKEVAPTFYDGLKAQEIIDAAIEADQRQNWVSLS